MNEIELWLEKEKRSRMRSWVDKQIEVVLRTGAQPDNADLDAIVEKMKKRSTWRSRMEAKEQFLLRLERWPEELRQAELKRVQDEVMEVASWGHDPVEDLLSHLISTPLLEKYRHI